MKTNRNQITVIIIVVVVLLAAIPLVAYVLRMSEKEDLSKYYPPIEVVRKALYDEFYGYCQGRPSYPQNEIPSIAKAKVQVPKDVGWCMRQWIIRDKAAQWWAADVQRMKMEPASEPGEIVWVKITYDAWVATESPIEGQPAKIEHTKPVRKLMFRKDESGRWVFQGVDKDLGPEEY